MSDSSKSVQKSFEKSVKFGEKEPKEEVFSDDEPARKRSKNMGNSENFQDSSEISELKRELEDSKNVIEEMGLWMKKLEKLHDEDIDFLKKSINDLAGKSEKDRKKLKQNFDEQIEELKKIHQEKFDKMANLDILKKSMNESIANLKHEFAKKSEEDREKLKKEFHEKIEKIKAEKVCKLEDVDSSSTSTNDLVANFKKEFAEKITKIEKIHQESLFNFYQENSKIQKDCQEKIDKMEKTYESKIADLRTAHEKKAKEFEKFRRQMEISGKLSISYNAGDTVYGKQSIVMSDNARIPPTKSELEFLFKCIFCKSEDHKSIDCRVFDNCSKREHKLREEQRCNRCLEPENTEKSTHFCPRAFVACSNCSAAPNMVWSSADLHHPIVCMYNEQTPDREVRRQAHNRDRIKSGLKPRFT
ncbi:hypothetical protein B9Z55_003464 [Caenorhabditis nigoni]|uniref:Uncharacterized protein n=1 Tax=Caenorhabditis nigoni TaxID=1611254 RepID=A0A2G5VQL5_9PELO|nr:hypothetical protein B9Z55_003464 [Caenorhabditis nigoni]